jgi:hypothetical protein
MPVNMDPSKKRRKSQSVLQAPAEQAHPADHQVAPSDLFGEETAADREKAMADAEWKNLWDATEVIDMDKI